MTGDPHAGAPVLAAGRELGEAVGAMVLLHGRGATAEDILGLAAELRHPGFSYLAPQAAGHTWYPYSFLAPLEENEPSLTSALALVSRLVERVGAAGLAPERTVLLGFSQGACLAAEWALRNPGRYGAVASLTGGFLGPLGPLGTERRFAGDLPGTPVLLGAGDPDPHVPWSRVEETAEAFRTLGAAVTLRRYPGLGHAINPEELELVRGLMATVGNG